MKLMTLNRLANELSNEAISTEQIKSIFNKSWKYCTGKYATTIKDKEFDATKPVWYVTRSDKYGSYLLLMTVDTRLLTDEEVVIYNRIVSIWNKRD